MLVNPLNSLCRDGEFGRRFDQAPLRWPFQQAIALVTLAWASAASSSRSAGVTLSRFHRLILRKRSVLHHTAADVGRIGTIATLSYFQSKTFGIRRSLLGGPG